MKKINVTPGTTAAMAAYICMKENKPYVQGGIRYRIKSITPNGNRAQVKLIPEK